MKTVAIIPAAGAGRRMEGGIPKQYLPLAGIPILVHTLRVFHLSAVIDEIFLAVPPRDVPDVRRDIVMAHGLGKVSLVLAGGAERQDTVRNALAHVRADHGIILVHDGARPFVTEEMIERVASAAKAFGAVAVGVPATDTVKEADSAGWVARTLPRDGVWLAQTPQGFSRPVIVAAYERAAAEGFRGTDDASLVERTGVPVRMIVGDQDNIKVTTPGDLLRGDLILSGRLRCASGSVTTATA